MQIIFIIIILAIFLFTVGFLYWFTAVFRVKVKKEEEEIKHRIYELAILKEVGDRIGYSLNLEKIVDIITGSLPQFIEYSAASYMLVEPNKILFKTELQKPVSKEFIDDIKKRMLSSLSALLNKELSEDMVEELVTGAVLMQETKEPVRSFFNIPLVIGGNVFGVLTVAHSKEGLYSEKEMTLLYKIVKQASVAVSSLEDVIKTEQGKSGAILESMIDGVVMTDINYRIVVANPAAKRAIGLEKKEEVTIFDFIDNLGKKFDIRGKLEESVKLDKILVENDVVIGKRVFQIFVSPVKGKTKTDKKETFGGVTIFHDVTKEKEAQRIREDFTSMMVHELRSPLDGIKKMGELMHTDPSIMENKKIFNEYLQMMYQSSSDMLELVNELLDVAKIESGKFDIQVIPSDIKKIINDRIKFFGTTAKDAKIELSSFFDEKIPESVNIDPQRISQVLNNLLSNAIKFTDTGGRVVVHAFVHKKTSNVLEEVNRIGIKWFIIDNVFEGYPNSLIVSVTDTGKGISKEDIEEKLFNKFIQLEATARSGKHGTGLGLVVAKGIIEAHGGIIGVASEEGAGSTFYFTIKL